MLELILDAAKIVLSDDARRSAAGLIDFIRKSPAWQKDICSLEANVNKDSREHAYFLGQLTKEKMQVLHYEGESISAFEFVYHELVANAFEHGCSSTWRRDTVTIALEITAHFITVTVKNPRGSRFDLGSIVAKKRQELAADPDLRRGRGLVVCTEQADELVTVAKGAGVKAVFYNPPAKLKVKTSEGQLVIQPVAGLRNPSLIRKIKHAVSQTAQKDVVLDLSTKEAIPDTRFVSLTLDLREELARDGRKLSILDRLRRFTFKERP